MLATLSAESVTISIRPCARNARSVSTAALFVSLGHSAALRPLFKKSHRFGVHCGSSGHRIEISEPILRSTSTPDANDLADGADRLVASVDAIFAGLPNAKVVKNPWSPWVDFSPPCAAHAPPVAAQFYRITST